MGCLNAPLNLSGLFDNEDLLEYPILFTTRDQYKPDHHNTATFYPNYDDEYNDGHFVGGSALKLLKLEKGDDGSIIRNVVVLLQTATGLIRDPEVSFDATKILFSMRKDIADTYHIYEINIDGTGLKQLTFFEKTDDIDPAYMPDGSIVFTSTREKKYIHCNRHISACLYKMDADGANIHRISQNTLFDNNTSLLSDGRIIYSRWEYVDRNFGDAQGLWVSNPDGTNHAIWYGNNTASPGGFLDPREVPGSDLVVSTLSSCHDRPWGGIGILDRKKSVDGPEAYTFVHPKSLEKYIGLDGPVPMRYNGGEFAFDNTVQMAVKYEDPYPINDKLMLVSKQYVGETVGISLLTTNHEEMWIYKERKGCYDPMLVKPRNLPPSRSVARSYDPDVKTGFLYVANVYEGTHMKGVEEGEVKYLRVVEAPSKDAFGKKDSWEGQGMQAPAMAFKDFYNKVILGEVPVEEDGSVYFEVPSEKFIYFQLLDKNKKMIQSMRSGTHVQPGEQQGCIGCHDDRLGGKMPSHFSIATKKGPVQLQKIGASAKMNGAINYLTDVQPIWDRNCLDCHDFGKDAAKTINLAPDKTSTFNVSYSELWSKDNARLLSVVGGGKAEIMQAKSWGSNVSPLVKMLEAGHAGVTLTKDELEMISTWIDLNAPYYPTYASAYVNGFTGRSPLTMKETMELGALAGFNIYQLRHSYQYPGFQISFDRPELSPALKGLVGPSRARALEIIQTGADRLKANPRQDMLGAKPSEEDCIRLESRERHQQIEAQFREAIFKGEKMYDRAEF